MGYADDLVSTASTLQGLQRQADIVSAFALCFDMEISVTKLGYQTPPGAVRKPQGSTHHPRQGLVPPTGGSQR